MDNDDELLTVAENEEHGSVHATDGDEESANRSRDEIELSMSFNGLSLLEYLIEHNALEELHTLFTHDPEELYRKHYNGHYIVHRAIENGRAEAVRIFHEHKVFVNLAGEVDPIWFNTDYEFVPSLVVARDDLEIFNMLIHDFGADYTSVQEGGDGFDGFGFGFHDHALPVQDMERWEFVMFDDLVDQSLKCQERAHLLGRNRRAAVNAWLILQSRRSLKPQLPDPIQHCVLQHAFAFPVEAVENDARLEFTKLSELAELPGAAIVHILASMNCNFDDDFDEEEDEDDHEDEGAEERVEKTEQLMLIVAHKIECSPSFLCVEGIVDWLNCQYWYHSIDIYKEHPGCSHETRLRIVNALVCLKERFGERITQKINAVIQKMKGVDVTLGVRDTTTDFVPETDLRNDLAWKRELAQRVNDQIDICNSVTDLDEILDNIQLFQNPMAQYLWTKKLQAVDFNECNAATLRKIVRGASTILHTGTRMCRDIAIPIIRKLTCKIELHDAMEAAHVIEHLVPHLSTGNTQLRFLIVTALANLCGSAERQQRVVKMNAIPALLLMAEHSEWTGRHRAAAVLANLALLGPEVCKQIAEKELNETSERRRHAFYKSFQDYECGTATGKNEILCWSRVVYFLGDDYKSWFGRDCDMDVESSSLNHVKALWRSYEKVNFEPLMFDTGSDEKDQAWNNYYEEIIE